MTVSQNDHPLIFIGMRLKQADGYIFLLQQRIAGWDATLAVTRCIKCINQLPHVVIQDSTSL